MDYNFKVVAHEPGTGVALYQLELRKVNGRPLLIGPLANLRNADQIRQLIKLGEVVGNILEPEYPVKKVNLWENMFIEHIGFRDLQHHYPEFYGEPNE